MHASSRHADGIALFRRSYRAVFMRALLRGRPAARVRLELLFAIRDVCSSVHNYALQVHPSKIDHRVSSGLDLGRASTHAVQSCTL